MVHVGVGPHRHPLARPLVLGDGAGRLEGHGRRARPAEPAPDDPVRPGEVALDVAKGQGAAEYEVRAEVLVDERSAGPEGALHVAHHRERFPLDLDEVDRVLGDVAVHRRHRRDRLSGEADLLDGDGVLDDRLGAEGGDGPRQHRRLLARHHGQDAGERLRPARVDALDPRVGIGAPEDGRVEHS